MDDADLILGLLGKFLQFQKSILTAMNRPSPNGRAVGEYFEEVVVAVHGSICRRISHFQIGALSNGRVLNAPIERGETDCNGVPLRFRAEFDDGNQVGGERRFV